MFDKTQILKLRGNLKIEHTLARKGAEKFRKMLGERQLVRSLGAQTGLQAVQMVRAGLPAIYVSGWQVAADANLASSTYPDQSLYPSNSVPAHVRRVNNALQRADQVDSVAGKNDIDWFVPIIADAEAGFGGSIHAYELMKGMIEAGAAAVHFEDQLASEKKCGHLGGKVLVPTSQFVKTLKAARLAAEVCDVPSVIIARTDAHSARLITSDIDVADHNFMSGGRTEEGYFNVHCGLESAIQRGLAYAPYADVLWFETSEPNIDDARAFAKRIHEKFPGKWLAYNCSPSFHWSKHLSPEAIASFQNELHKFGYGFQFVTLAGFHANNHSMFELALAYNILGMSAYVALQESEFVSAQVGYTAVKHQQEVGTGVFDEIAKTVGSTTTALVGSTEEDQF